MKRKTRKKVVVKKKKLKAGVFFLFLIFIAIASAFLYNQEPVSESKITIHSPENKTYFGKNVLVNISCSENMIWINDTVDEKPLFNQCTHCYSYFISGLTFETGTHRYAVYAKDFNDTMFSKEIVFTVQ